jgi:hypothetical protein
MNPSGEHLGQSAVQARATFHLIKQSCCYRIHHRGYISFGVF